MGGDGAEDRVAGGVMARLRAETAPAHARLEQALDLLRPPLSPARFADLLDRFHAFHRVWEPAVAARLDPALLAGRAKLDLLESDLRRLGRAPSRAACPLDPGLTRTPAAALGSLYVLEGATLGGQVIGRALRATDWGGGLRYFEAYGAGTKAMWAAFKVFVELNSGKHADEIVSGAVATFDFLTAWLAPAPRPAG